MKITTEITERDKKLIALTLVLLIVTGFVFLIIQPLAEANAKAGEEFALQTELMLKTQEKLALLPSLKGKENKVNEELAAQGAAFSPTMRSQEIDRYLTGMILSGGLEAKQLVITMPDREMTLEPYFASDAAAGTGSGSSGTEDAGTDSSSSGTEEEQILTPEEAQAAEEASEVLPTASAPNIFTGLYSAQVSLDISGNRSELQKLIDHLSGMAPSARITSVVWGMENSSNMNEDGEYITSVRDSVQLRLELYMIKEMEGILYGNSLD